MIWNWIIKKVVVMKNVVTSQREFYEKCIESIMWSVLGEWDWESWTWKRKSMFNCSYLHFSSAFHFFRRVFINNTLISNVSPFFFFLQLILLENTIYANQFCLWISSWALFCKVISISSTNNTHCMFFFFFFFYLWKCFTSF